MKRFIIVIVILLVFGGFYISTKLDDQKQAEPQTAVDEEVYVDKESVTDLVAKFNTEVMNSNLNYPASDDYFQADDGVYWYGLYDDIYLYAEPLEYSGNRDEDIVDIMAINFPKDSPNQDMALNFAKCLIKANNPDITDEEVDELIDLAIENSKDKGVASIGTGITVARASDDTIYEYQVVRIYK